MALEAHRRAADQAYRSVGRERVAALARQRPVQLTEERVEHGGQTRDAIDRWVLQYDTTVELRRRVRVSVVRAPAREARLQRVLRGEVREGRDAQHREQARVLAPLVSRIRECR